MKGGSDAVRVAKPKKRLHVRAIVRDGLRAFVGSQSLRKEELASRREVGLLINNPTVSRRILQVFERDWVEWGGTAPDDLDKTSATDGEKRKDKARTDEELALTSG